METLFVGTNVIFLPEVDSTNSYAIGLLKNVNLPEGTLIHTAHQTAGKGQRGNVWNTLPYSNITASVVLRPTFLEVKKQFFLYQVAALACYDVLSQILDSGQYDIKIKWPNDILVNNLKIAGILIENIINGNSIAHSIIGIGMNVKQREFVTGVNATSLELLTGQNYKLDDVLGRLCSQLEKSYLLLKQGAEEQLQARYYQNLLGINTIREFDLAERRIRLMVKGTSPDGFLLLADEEGVERKFDVQEIKWVL